MCNLLTKTCSLSASAKDIYIKKYSIMLCRKLHSYRNYYIEAEMADKQNWGWSRWAGHMFKSKSH